MIELLIVLALVVGVAAVALVAWTSILMAGVVVTGAGLLFGVPTALYYHLLLARSLVAAKADTPRWWLNPSAHHHRLDEASRRRVLPWFYAGGAGFVVTVSGLALFALGLAVAYFRRSLVN